jgi:predicted ATP-dependent protease
MDKEGKARVRRAANKPAEPRADLPKPAVESIDPATPATASTKGRGKGAGKDDTLSRPRTGVNAAETGVDAESNRPSSRADDNASNWAAQANTRSGTRSQAPGALPALNAAREFCRVPADLALLSTVPTTLPDTPKESGGLFALLPSSARRALTLGLTAREPNFHVFVSADSEIPLEDELVRFAERVFANRPPPQDIVYVHDFARPEAPRPLSLPAGRGVVLVEGMRALIQQLKEEIPGLAEQASVKRAQGELGKKLEERNRELISGLELTAKTLGFGIRSVPGGIQTFPILHGKPLTAEQFSVLDESTKRALTDAEQKLTTEVEKAATLVRAAGSEFENKRGEAFGRAAEALIAKHVAALAAEFQNDGAEVTQYLEEVAQALANDWEDLIDVPRGDRKSRPDEDDEEASGGETDPEHARDLERFRVNLLVARDPASPPPVVYETNPTFPNLFGYLERRARFGALLTDFTRIRAGSIHLASGGVLIVRGKDLLTDPMIWERMKRVLRERHLGPEDPLGPLGLYATTLRPKHVPVSLRVVLVGPEDMFAALLNADPDFAALFRVKVEVPSSVRRTPEALVNLDALLAALGRERQWGRFTREARAKMLDLATRLSGDRERLSLHLGPLEETAAFASALAAARAFDDKSPDERPTDSGEGSDSHLGDGSSPSLRRPFRASSSPPDAETVTAEEIELAWRERRERTGSAERQFRELIVRGELSLDTEGARVGVINGLSVLSTGDVEFGQPVRITAVVALGREGVVDVEREAQLSGAIHTKGVQILRGYLGKVFGQERPLSLRAQLAFEQSYGEIDGDSASAAELFALVSALADVGIDQGIAVTGSMNQLGAIQAVGGVCAKIEGFFEVCAARGLTGSQGVVLPRANLQHLVLREDVAAAIEAGKFHLYGIESVTQGIEILTGVPAGERDSNGRFPASSVFGRVERRIIEIAERLREAETAQRAVPAALESSADVSAADLGGTDDADFARLLP